MKKGFPDVVPIGGAKHWSEEDKVKLVEETLKECSKVCLATYYLLDLKEGLNCKMLHEDTGDWFLISFNKIDKPDDI